MREEWKSFGLGIRRNMIGIRGIGKGSEYRGFL